MAGRASHHEQPRSPGTVPGGPRWSAPHLAAGADGRELGCLLNGPLDRPPRPSGPDSHLRSRLGRAPAGAACLERGPPLVRKRSEGPANRCGVVGGGTGSGGRRVLRLEGRDQSGDHIPGGMRRQGSGKRPSLRFPPAGRERPILLTIFREGVPFSYSPSWLSTDSQLSGADSAQQLLPRGAQNGYRGGSRCLAPLDHA
jgi:hypothetical protein